MSAVPGSRTGGAPSPSYGADELSSVSVKEPVGKRASVVSGLELGSVETGVAKEASRTTVISSKVLETGPAQWRIQDLRKGGARSISREARAQNCKQHPQIGNHAH